MGRWAVSIDLKASWVCLVAVLGLSACQYPKGPPPSTSVPAFSSPLPLVSVSFTSTTVPTLTPTLVTPPPRQVTFYNQYLDSPDGQWQAESSFEQLEGGAAYRVRLIVRKLDQSVEWAPVDSTQRGIGYILPTLRYWSPDSKHFYFFNMPVGEACGVSYYPEENEWVELNVVDGSLASFPLPSGLEHTVSPDGRTMIYGTSTPPYGLRFRDLETGTEEFRPFTIPGDESTEVQAGGWVWSPDGGSVALSVAYLIPSANRCLNRGPFSVLRIDNMADPRFTPLIEHSRELVRLRVWETADRILAEDWNGYTWWMGSRSGLPAEAPNPQAP